MPNFTDQDKKILSNYVTSTDRDVFAIKNLPGLTGAIYARYSRALGGFRETMLKEFIHEGLVDQVKAGDLIERILIAYGDDSVAELEGAHVSFENISTLCTKEIEDRRIGGSPIEQSTRYVFYDQKNERGEFRYYRPKSVLNSAHHQDYLQTMDFIFQTYTDLVEPMKNFYKSKKPLTTAEYDINGDKVKEKLQDLTDHKEIKAFQTTYNADIRTQACDSLRALLPLALLTNVGIFGNGRFFEHVLSHGYTSTLPEAQQIAQDGQAALDQIIPRYVKRAKKNEYLSAIDQNMTELAPSLFQKFNHSSSPNSLAVDLLDHDQNQIALKLEQHGLTPKNVKEFILDEEDIVTMATMLFPYLNLSLRQIRDEVRTMSSETRGHLIKTYLGNRENRRHRPGRALETGYPYTFDLLTDYGTYKDLERHRMGSQLRQKFTPNLGFNYPPDLLEAGFKNKIDAVIDASQNLYQKLQKISEVEAQYATLHGSLVRWVLAMNDRALMHMIELRSTPQGHPQYRKVVQKMHDLVTTRSPWRGAAMKFADHHDYASARGASEAKQRVKEAALGI